MCITIQPEELAGANTARWPGFARSKMQDGMLLCQNCQTLKCDGPGYLLPAPDPLPPRVPVHHLKHDGQANSTRWRIRALHRDVSFRLGCKEFDSRQKKSDWPKPLMDREVRLRSIVPLVSFLSTGKCRLKD